MIDRLRAVAPGLERLVVGKRLPVASVVRFGAGCLRLGVKPAFRRLGSALGCGFGEAAR